MLFRSHPSKFGMALMKFERQVMNTIDGDGSPEVDLGSLQVPIYALVGIAVAVAVVIGLGVWLAIRIMRKRARKKREERRDTLFLTVKGVIDESYACFDESTAPSTLLTHFFFPIEL